MFHIHLEVGTFLGSSDERDRPAVDSILAVARVPATAVEAEK
jgi:hypothetical protein